MIYFPPVFQVSGAGKISNGLYDPISGISTLAHVNNGQVAVGLIMAPELDNEYLALQFQPFMDGSQQFHPLKTLSAAIMLRHYNDDVDFGR